MRWMTRETISSITSSVMTGAGAGRAAASAFAADKFANGFLAGVDATGALGAMGLSAVAECEVGAKVDAMGATGG